MKESLVRISASMALAGLPLQGIYAKTQAVATVAPGETYSFAYRSILPGQRQILSWTGSTKPPIGAEIAVSLENKTVGTLTIQKVSAKTVLCAYKGEEISLSKLKQYQLKYLGIPSQSVNEPQKSIFAPDDDVNKETLPQVALGVHATFAHNDALDIAFNTALNREQNSLDASLLFAPPQPNGVEWLNWFWASFSYSYHVRSNSQVVLGDQERNYYLIADRPESYAVSGGIRIPTTISLLATVELYGSYELEKHRITLESKIIETTDQITVEAQRTLLGGAYTIRMVDNLFLQFLYAHSLDASLKISSKEKLIAPASGTIVTQEFGIKPYIYYELWDRSPQLDLKFEVAMTQVSNTYKAKFETISEESAPQDSQNRTTRLEHLRVRPSIRLGLQF